MSLVYYFLRESVQHVFLTLADPRRGVMVREMSRGLLEEYVPGICAVAEGIPPD